MRKKNVTECEFEQLDIQKRCCVCGKLSNLHELRRNVVLCGEKCASVMDKADVTVNRFSSYKNLYANKKKS